MLAVVGQIRLFLESCENAPSLGWSFASEQRWSRLLVLGYVHWEGPLSGGALGCLSAGVEPLSHCRLSAHSLLKLVCSRGLMMGQKAAACPQWKTPLPPPPLHYF